MADLAQRLDEALNGEQWCEYCKKNAPLDHFTDAKGYYCRQEARDEGALKEDQYKSPSSAHRLRQSAYRSAFGRSRSFGGVTNGKQEE